MIEHKRAYRVGIAHKINILKYLRDNEKRSISDIANHLELSNARVRVLLSEMIDENKIEKTGNGRSTRYFRTIKK